MQKKRLRISRGGLILLFSGFLTFCGYALLPAGNARAAIPAFVRIIHASPFVGTADVFVDGNPFLTSFAFGAVTSYASVPPGPHKVQIALVGKGIAGAALTETLPVEAGGVYTIAAIGTSPTNLMLEVFSDDNRTYAGTARVRFYQLSPNGGTIHLLNDGQSMTNIGYRQASTYFQMGTGANSFKLSSTVRNKSLAIDTTIQANTITSIFTVGIFGGTPKAEVIAKQVDALPGLPNTGSDPHAQMASGPAYIPWLLLGLALAVIGGTIFVRRVSLVR